MSTSPKKISSLLGTGSLKTILDVAKQTQETLLTVQEKLPTEYHAHLDSAWYQDEQLYIALNSPEWASKLRYEIDRFFGNERVEIKISSKAN
jgi:hypothetical protein